MREETFRLVGAPAIADLQFEVVPGRLQRVARCLTITWVIARAAAGDIRGDVSLAFNQHSCRTTWAPLFVCYLALVAAQSWRALAQGVVVQYPAAGTLERLPLPPAGDGLEPIVAGTIVAVSLACVAFAMVPAVSMLRRRAGLSRRTTLTVVLLIALMTYGAARLARPLQEAQDLFTYALVIRGGLPPEERVV